MFVRGREEVLGLLGGEHPVVDPETVEKDRKDLIERERVVDGGICVRECGRSMTGQRVDSTTAQVRRTEKGQGIGERRGRLVDAENGIEGTRGGDGLGLIVITDSIPIFGVVLPVAGSAAFCAVLGRYCGCEREQEGREKEEFHQRHLEWGCTTQAWS